MTAPGADDPADDPAVDPFFAGRPASRALFDAVRREVADVDDDVRRWWAEAWAAAA